MGNSEKRIGRKKLKKKKKTKKLSEKGG